MISFWNRISARMKLDFRLAMILMMASIMVLIVMPFAIYRLRHGDALLTLVDGGLVLFTIAAALWAWHRGNTQSIARLLSILNTAGVVTVSLNAGLPGLFWSYPVLVSNYFLISRSEATFLGVALLGVLALDGGVYTSPLMGYLFTCSMLMACLFAYVFAYRAEMHMQQLEKLISKDALTGANNRYAMTVEMASAKSAMDRSHIPSGLLLLDLDHFKRINDTHGHAEGDRVLVDFVRIVENNIRKSDRFFRYGGEEFVLLASPSTNTQLQQFGDALCRRVAEQLRSQGEVVTVSIGGTMLREAESEANWLIRADNLLYKAKHNGRNQTQVE